MDLIIDNEKVEVTEPKETLLRKIIERVSNELKKSQPRNQ